MQAISSPWRALKVRSGSIIEINSLLKIFIDIDIDRAFLLFLVSLTSSFSSFVNKTLFLKLIKSCLQLRKVLAKLEYGLMKLIQSDEGAMMVGIHPLW